MICSIACDTYFMVAACIVQRACRQFRSQCHTSFCWKVQTLAMNPFRLLSYFNWNNIDCMQYYLLLNICTFVGLSSQFNLLFTPCIVHCSKLSFLFLFMFSPNRQCHWYGLVQRKWVWQLLCSAICSKFVFQDIRSQIVTSICKP